MQIFVKTLDSSTVTLDVNPSDTIEDVLEQIEEINEPLSQQVRIFYGGSVLEEDLLLSDYNIQEGSTLDIVVGLQGGAKKRKKKNYTTPKKNKHKKKKVKLAVLSYYKVDEDGKVSRLRHECTNECGGGVFMAQHYNREYCGKCGFTYMLDKPEQTQ